TGFRRHVEPGQQAGIYRSLRSRADKLWRLVGDDRAFSGQTDANVHARIAGQHENFAFRQRVSARTDDDRQVRFLFLRPVIQLIGPVAIRRGRLGEAFAAVPVDPHDRVLHRPTVGIGHLARYPVLVYTEEGDFVVRPELETGVHPDPARVLFGRRYPGHLDREVHADRGGGR